MLLSRSGGPRLLGVSGAIFTIFCFAAVAAEPKAKSRAKEKKPEPSPSPFGGIPLPIGQEVKGLVLPDFDTEGRLRARFEAASAKRIDNTRILFTGLKVVSFTPENTPDLRIDMPQSILDLDTRVIRSEQRTTIARADFSIAGDAMQFDTNERKGTLTGNVKMVITDHSNFEPKTGE